MHNNPDIQNIAFIGGGNMARSIIGGMIASGWDATSIFVADPVLEQRSILENSFGVCCFENNSASIRNSDIVVLAVKPQMLQQAIESIRPELALNKPLIISIAAGIRIDSILKWADGELPVIRVMPNTPALVNCGISGMLAGPKVSDSQRTTAEQIMSSVGPVVWVGSEADIDTVTGISGSGPAYFFKLMEIMIATAERHGLDASAARQLVLQTALGASRLAMDSEYDPAELRRQVTSPRGTTEAALETMEAGGIDDTVANGIQAAISRSDELAKSLGEN